MPILILAIFGIGLLIVTFVIYQRRVQQQTKQKIPAYLEDIRQHQVLLKPDTTKHTYSGKFAGRLLRFSLGHPIKIQATLAVKTDADEMWIYPLKHPFKSDKLKSKLETNRAWTGNSDFDSRYILAGQPRHFANAVMQPAKRVQSRLLTYPNSVVIVDESGVSLQPNLSDLSQLTSGVWRELMGLVSDIAESVEAQYDPAMFSGIEVDESAYPDHKGGHVS